MKKILIAAIAALSLSGCAVPTPAEEPDDTLTRTDRILEVAR